MSHQYMTDGQITHESILKGGRYRDLSIKDADPETVKDLYAFMLRLRRCEEAIVAEYHPADEMRCPVHLSIGQEAVPAALSLLLEDDDYFFCSHRTHGYYFGKRAPLKPFIAELYGRATGANGGLSGSQDISFPPLNFHGGAILAGSIGIAVGVAQAIKLLGKPQVAAVGFGDGAVDEGIVWEAFNLAVLRKLPVVFVCENNNYSVFSPQNKRQPKSNISHRAASFGLKTYSLFGNDVIDVHTALSEAIRRARKGDGPSLVEAFTYRVCGHVGPEGDDHLDYRPREELEFWKSNCPIVLVEEQMLQNGLLTASEKQELIDRIDKEIEEAFSFAKKSPFPGAVDWGPLNYSNASPMADKLLQDLESRDFDPNQAEAKLAPY